MSPSESPQRRQVYYTGRVQGVGFRYTTRSIARRYAVTGYVRNLRDGRVELIAEGMPSELDAFLDDVRTRMSGYVVDEQCQHLPATGEFGGFEIGY